MKPNDLGLFDMHGNVSQWTQGVFGNKPIDKEVDGSEVVSGASFRVSRGGSWYDDAGSCRAANRFRPSPDDRTTFLCRCAVSFFHPELVGSWLKRGGKA